MNREHRIQVGNYLEPRITSPLHFLPKLSKEEEESLAQKNRKRAILACMKLCETHKSLNEFGMVETYAGKRRSSIDIWRHLKSFRPRVTIFGVMNSLYILDVYEEEVVSCFCNQIRRRVFILKESFPEKESVHYSSLDEFNLKISCWENI